MNTQEISEQLEALEEALKGIGDGPVEKAAFTVDPDFEAVLSGFLMGLVTANGIVKGEVTVSAPKGFANVVVLACCMAHMAAKKEADRELEEEKESTDK